MIILLLSLFSFSAEPTVAGLNTGQPVDPRAKIFVEVDKATQTVTIKGPAGNVTLVDPVTGKETQGTFGGELKAKVSTGGGLKNPNGKEKGDRAPYCANDPKHGTPDKIENRFVSANECPDKNFTDINNKTWPGCPRSKSVNYSMASIHYSGAFEDESGQQIPLRSAIKIIGGVYFHEVPSAYVDDLGKNVSGGCVRLPTRTARTLYALMKQHGGISVTIKGENPPMIPGQKNYCTDEMVAAFHKKLLDKGQSAQTWDPTKAIGDWVTEVTGAPKTKASGKASKGPSEGNLSNIFMGQR